MTGGGIPPPRRNPEFSGKERVFVNLKHNYLKLYCQSKGENNGKEKKNGFDFDGCIYNHCGRFSLCRRLQVWLLPGDRVSNLRCLQWNRPRWYL
jgi:hypothetical protein